MTLKQAIKAARIINVNATDVIDIDVSKKQARELITKHDYLPYETHAGEGVDTWELRGDILFLLIVC